MHPQDTMSFSQQQEFYNLCCEYFDIVIQTGIDFFGDIDIEIDSLTLPELKSAIKEARKYAGLPDVSVKAKPNKTQPKKAPTDCNVGDEVEVIDSMSSVCSQRFKLVKPRDGFFGIQVKVEGVTPARHTTTRLAREQFKVVTPYIKHEVKQLTLAV